MPYDMDFDSAPDALQSPSRSDNGILAAMKAAGRALVRSAKRAAGGGIVSALVAAGLALCAPQGANAQCYEFASAGNASVSVNITNLPPPAIVGGVYEYQLQSATGNTVTVTQGSSTWSLTPPFSDFLITVYPYSSPPVAFTNVGIGAESLVDSNLISGIVTLTDSVSDILPTGWPPVTFPPLSDWNATATVQVQVNGVTFGPYNLTSISDCVPPPPPAKTLGSPCDGPGGCGGGDPITLGTGNVFEQALDYSTVGQNPLAFTRYYNSMAITSYPNTFATTLGTNWRSTFDRYLNIASGSSVLAERADGQVLSFTLNGSTWTPDSDVDVTLTNAGTVWTLTDHNDTVEKYTASGTKATLQSITLRNGYEQTLNYSSGQLASVTDSYNRELVFGYSGGLLQTLSTPDGLTLTYGFTSAGGSNVLSTVSYSTTPVTNITYQYQNAAFPFALTGLIDENGQPFSNWAYDTNGRGVTSQRGGALGADLTTVIYNPDGTTTATNAFGVADTYTFTTLQGVPKVMQIQRAATATTAAATRTFNYDLNGYVNYATDWNTNLTTYVNDSHGDPLTIIEAVNSPAVTRTTTIVYDDPVFVHLPKTITTAGLTTGFTYDGNGNPLTQTDTDTTTNTVPYSTGGQTRVTQYMWTTTGQEKSVQLPRTDVVALTQFGYDGTGALISITDALAHETQITAHTGGGLPLTVVDPNNVTTKLTYDQRLNLNTSTLFTTAGKLTTTWTHDPANNLTAVQQPDGSKLAYGYDGAHRLTDVTDLFGNNLHNTLDALGDVTLAQIKPSGGAATWQHSGVFDALGRVLQDIGGMGQITAYTYDPMSNVLTITPPAPSGIVTRVPDALNRLSTSTDPAPGGTTTWGYDAHDRVITVKDANGNTTAYTYNGFGDMTQLASPDSGTSVYYYDPDRNLTQSVKPGKLTMIGTYDALDRPLATTYPNDATLNVSRNYDEPGHGFGIGYLTSATDQAGSLSLTYDQRADITNESRTVTGAGTLNTATAYDKAMRVQSITYPSGTLVHYTRNAMGQVTAVTATPPAGSASNVATGISYKPFPSFGIGPVKGLSYGNGVAGAYSFDLDYRNTTRKDTGAAPVQSLSYTYYLNNSVYKIADTVNAANSQTLHYDTLDRLTGAASGTGGYGTFSFTWDPVSNLTAQTINGTKTSYSHKPGTNRLNGITTAGTTTTVTSTQTGNLDTFKTGTTTTETLLYNQANQLASSQTTSTFASYAYDLTGQRLEKSQPGVNPVLYQFNRTGGELLSENDLHGGTTADYIYLDPGRNSQPLGEVNPTTGKLYFTHTDKLGTPQVLTDSTQSVAWSATYQPFGSTVQFNGPLATQSLRLPGQQFDAETGYNHNGFRNYAGSLTRYLESDPIGLNGGMNTFQYVGGNPFKNIDPNGSNWTINTYPPESILNPFGHIGIGSSYPFQSSPTIGYYPVNSPAMYGPGILQLDTGYNPGNSFTLQTNPLQDLLIQNYLQGLANSSPDYNAFSNNCAQTLGNALREAGFPVPGNIYMPDQLNKWLNQYQPYTPIPQTPSVPTPVPLRSKPTP